MTLWDQWKISCCDKKERFHTAEESIKLMKEKMLGTLRIWGATSSHVLKGGNVF